MEKSEAYSEIYAPGLTSRLAPLLIAAGLYLNYLWFNKGNKVSKVIHIIFLCEIAPFVLAKFKYVGLRFQGACMFVKIVFLKNNSEEIVKGKKYSKNLVLVSVIGILIFVKNITTVISRRTISFFYLINFIGRNKIDLIYESKRSNTNVQCRVHYC